MSALLTPLKLLRVRNNNNRTPCEIRQISSVYLPTEVWLWVRQFLNLKDLRALSSVCLIFRNIFPPCLPTKVYIRCQDKPRDIEQMLSAFAKCPSLLRNISKIEFKIWDSRLGSQPTKAPVLNHRSTPIISAFLRNVSQMPRLQSAGFAGIKVEQEHLALLFQSNTLHDLILFRCSLPRSVRLPPSPVRHLTLSLRDHYKHVEPLLGHCSANLEALDFTGHLLQLPGSMRFPLFPKLRELKFYETSESINDLNTLISRAPQLEHLELYGRRNLLSRLSALPVSITRLTINRHAIGDGDFAGRFIQLPHLHVTHYHNKKDVDDRRGLVIPIIQRIFPDLTSLDLNILWDFRNFALLIARHLPNVTQLKLRISWPSAYDLDIGPYLPHFAAPEGPLARLYVDLDTANKIHIETCKSWVIHVVLGLDPGLGGPYLQEIEMIFSNSRSSVVLETNGKGGRLQSIQRNEERMLWAYSHGQVYEGPYVGDRDFR